MRQSLDDIIEYNVDDSLYLKKDEFEKRKYLKNSLNICCTVEGDNVYIFNDNIKPPQILKIKRTDEEKRLRRLYGDSGIKFGRGKYLDVTDQGFSNTLTTFSTDNYVWDRNYKVRELTNRETFKLMGVCDDDVETLLNTVPKTQCKKLAGNSICVNVMSEIFKKLFCQKSNNPETSLF
jgi:site-specific DNA-cytosine methylase